MNTKINQFYDQIAKKFEMNGVEIDTIVQSDLRMIISDAYFTGCTDGATEMINRITSKEVSK